MEKLPLDSLAINRLIEERFNNNKAKFLRHADLHKTTLTRWLNGTSQPQAERFLRFCGAFDVDFFALLEATPESVQLLSYVIAQAALLKGWKDTLPSLAFLQNFLLAPGDWPDLEIANHYNHKRKPEWSTWDFQYDPKAGRRDYYITFDIKFSTDPQVWYFAFQEPESSQWMWFRYGCVRKRWNELLLLNFVFMGELDIVELSSEIDRIAVQTYLGGRPTTYRIASLHPFEARVSEIVPASPPPVRFRQPGLG